MNPQKGTTMGPMGTLHPKSCSHLGLRLGFGRCGLVVGGLRFKAGLGNLGCLVGFTVSDMLSVQVHVFFALNPEP